MDPNFNPNEHFLETDPPIPGQNYVCISLISPEDVIKQKNEFLAQKFINHLLNDEGMRRFLKEREGTQVTYEEAEDFYKGYLLNNGDALQAEFDQLVDFRTNVRGVKVRGVYDSEREAQFRAKQLWKRDPSVNIWVAKMGSWLPFNADPSQMTNVEYNQGELNTLMQKKMEADRHRDEVFQKNHDESLAEIERQNALKREAIERERAERGDTTERIEVPLAAPDMTKAVQPSPVVPPKEDVKEALAEFEEIMTAKREAFDAMIAGAPASSSSEAHGGAEQAPQLFSEDDPWMARKGRTTEHHDPSDLL